MAKDRHYLVFAIIFILGTAVRLIGLSRDIWLDEYSSIALASSENLLTSLRSYDHPPLYYLILKLLLNLNGNIYFARLFSVVISLGTALLIYLWIKRYSRKASLVALLLAFFCGPFIIYSQEIRDYSLLLFFSAASFLAAKTAIDNPDKNAHWLELGIFLAAAVSSHLVGIMLLPSIVAYIFFEVSSPKGRCLKGTFIASAFPVILFIFWRDYFLTNLSGHTKGSWWIPEVSFQSALGYLVTVMGLPQAMPSFTSLKTGGLSATISLISSLGFIILFTVFLLEFFKGEIKKSFPLLLAALFYFLALYIYSAIFVPILIPRTLLPLLIPFTGFVSLQIATIPSIRSQIIAVVILSALAITTVADWVFNRATRAVEPWREVLAITQPSKNAIVLCPDYIEGIYRYYSKAEKLENVYTISLRSTDSIKKVADLLQSKTPPHQLLMVTYLSKNRDYCINSMREIFKRSWKIENVQKQILMEKSAITVYAFQRPE